MTKSPGRQALCPSAPGVPGAVLIGVVGEDGRVAHLGTPLSVDASFLDAARASGSPERRFRFSSPCAEGRCAQWDGSGCGLIERVLHHVTAAGAPEMSQTLRACAIRASCRWWRQRGAAACAVCPLVVTDAGVPAQDPAPDGRRSVPAAAGDRRGFEVV